MYFESAKRDVDYDVGALPEYAGLYASRYLHFQNPPEVYANLNPAAGSPDLIAPRGDHGRAGDSMGSLTLGPVTGNMREYSGLNTQFPRYTSRASGPNKGGDDANIGAALAYQASQIQAMTQGESAAAIAGRH